MKILLVGPLPPPIAGDTQLFSMLVHDLGAQQSVETRVVNTSRDNQSGNILMNLWIGLRVFVSVMRYGAQFDVITFHSSDRGMCFFCPVLYLLARIFRKPLIVRLFGGSFDDYYVSSGRFLKYIVERTVLSADLCLFETRRLMAFSENRFKARVGWLPNYRQTFEQVSQTQNSVRNATCQKLVFLGHMWKTKGIETILESVPLLPPNVSIDLYGPLDEYSSDQINQRGCGKVRYAGLLQHKEVVTKLADYDALVLPTFHSGEGYPGVILEAFSCGLPVITTRWMSIPEIVDETCGILIEPGSVGQFVDAICELNTNPSMVERLRAGSKGKSPFFSDVHWTNEFLRFCGKVTHTGLIPEVSE
jgi:glycosyltransferase involved in cell wall biosynthesis